MQHFTTIHPEPGRLQVQEFPNAAKIIKVGGPKAKRLADLALHKRDLEFAKASLLAINDVPPKPSVAREALWRIAIVHFFKCFGDSAARFQLSAQKVLKSEGPIALEVFDFFKNLRDKHLVHDENSFLQSVPGAVLSEPGKTYKIEKIVCFSVSTETLHQDSFGNMLLLVDAVLRWVVGQFDALCNEFTHELEALPYEDLLSKDAVTYRSAEYADVGITRNAP